MKHKMQKTLPNRVYMGRDGYLENKSFICWTIKRTSNLVFSDVNIQVSGQNFSNCNVFHTMTFTVEARKCM